MYINIQINHGYLGQTRTPGDCTIALGTHRMNLGSWDFAYPPKVKWPLISQKIRITILISWCLVTFLKIFQLWLSIWALRRGLGVLSFRSPPPNHICFRGVAKFLEHESHENTSKSRVTNTDAHTHKPGKHNNVTIVFLKLL